MNKENIIKILKKAKEGSKRNFKQTYDLVINLKGLDFKKPTDQIDFFMQMPHDRGKTLKIAAIVGPELKSQADKVCDLTIDDLSKYSDKKAALKLAREYDFFIAQANLMANIAKSLGKILGPAGKMPNPKAGCIVPPNANLQPLYNKLKETIRITAKTSFSFKCSIGKEDMEDEKAAENILSVYTNMLHHLPAEKSNIKSVLLKLTMGKPIKLI